MERQDAKMNRCLGMAAESNEEYMLAIKHFKNALKCVTDEKEKVEINFQIGLLYQLQIEKENLIYPDDEERIRLLDLEAKKHFEISRNEKYYDFYVDSSVQLGEVLYMGSEYEEAIHILSELDNRILDEDNQRDVNTIIGMCYFSLGDYMKAIHYLSKINDSIVDINTVRAFTLLGKAYFLTDNVSQAIKHYIKLIAYHKHYPDYVTKEDVGVICRILEEIIEEDKKEKGLFLKLFCWKKAVLDVRFEDFELLGDALIEVEYVQLGNKYYHKALSLCKNGSERNRIKKKIADIT